MVCFLFRSPLIEWLLEAFSLHGTFIIISGILLNVIPCAILFAPPEQTKPREEVNEASKVPLISDLVQNDQKNPTAGTTYIYANINRQSKHDLDNTTSLQNNREKERNHVEIILKKGSINCQELKASVNDIGMIGRQLMLFKNSQACLFFFSQLFFFSGYLIPFIYAPDKAKEHGKHLKD